MNIYLFSTLLAFTFAYALWKGDRDARIAAVVCVAATVITHLLMSPLNVRYQDVQFSSMVIDLALLAAFITLALFSSSFWPLWIAGLQLTASSAHFLKFLDSNLMPFAYAVAERFWGYPILLIIAIGAFRAHQRAIAAPDRDPAMA